MVFHKSIDNAENALKNNDIKSSLEIMREYVKVEASKSSNFAELEKVYKQYLVKIAELLRQLEKDSKGPFISPTQDTLNAFGDVKLLRQDVLALTNAFLRDK